MELQNGVALIAIGKSLGNPVPHSLEFGGNKMEFKKVKDVNIGERIAISGPIKRIEYQDNGISIEFELDGWYFYPDENELVPVFRR